MIAFIVALTNDAGVPVALVGEVDDRQVEK
jgi:hypothetical protein